MRSTTSRNPWIHGLAILGGMALGVVFLIAAWGKALDPLAFAEEIRAQGLELVLSAPLLAVLFVAVEAALGVALLLGLRRLWVVAPTTALAALFVFLNGRAYWRFRHGLIDASDSCGCFGSLLSRTPAEAFWQDLLLLVPPLVLVWMGIWIGDRARADDGARGGGPGEARPLLRTAVVALAAVAAAIFTYLAPGLPLDDLATRLEPGVHIGDLCAGSEAADSVRICLDGLAPDLESGRHFVVIAGVEEAALAERIDDLNALSGQVGAGEVGTGEVGTPRVWLLTASSEEERAAFFWQYGPAFEIREVPETLLRSLYRTTPRSFEVLDGEVTRTFTGIPPAAEMETESHPADAR
jgi:uncharacterized membrane protein YphA (DoxX/SURF4 family)